MSSKYKQSGEQAAAAELVRLGEDATADQVTGRLPEGPIPGQGEHQTFLYDDEIESGFIIRNEGDGRFKAEEWRDGDIADNVYGSYAAMEAWTKKNVVAHNLWRINNGYLPCTEDRKLPEAGIPSQVKDHVIFWLNRLRGQEAALHGVQLARGNGHILALELSDRDAKIREGMTKLDEFRTLAAQNGVDGDAFIQECGGVPNFEKYGYVAQPSGKLPEVKQTSRALAAQYPVKGSMPRHVIEELYQLREAEVESLGRRDVIHEVDLRDLDRLGRFMVADGLFEKCDEAARHALLHDEHAHVRSCAEIAKRDLRAARLKVSQAPSPGM